MALQEDHDLADGLLLAPAGRDATETRLPDAIDLEQALRRALDDIEDVLAERCDQPAGEVRADPLDHARAEIAPDALDGGGRHHLQEAGTELQPMLAVLLPLAAGLDALAGMHLGRRAQHRDEISMAAHLDTKHAKAGLGAVERHALDEPRQGLSTVFLVWYGFSHGAYPIGFSSTETGHPTRRYRGKLSRLAIQPAPSRAASSGL